MPAELQGKVLALGLHSGLTKLVMAIAEEAYGFGQAATKREPCWREDTAFVEWYKAYPRRCDPADAHKAYRRVIRDGLATHEVLIERAREYGRTVDKRYTKLPATWLNKHSFLSEERTQVSRGALFNVMQDLTGEAI
jgi:hypothetical protein